MIQLRRKGSHGVKGVGRILGNDCWGLKEKGDEVEVAMGTSRSQFRSCSFVIIKKKRRR